MYNVPTVKLTGRDRLDAFKVKHNQARGPVDAWIDEIKRADWRTMADLKNRCPQASILAGNIVVFNISGNKYRLEARVVLVAGTVTVTRIGTHTEYDKW
jgi:mRNA interferase HigB